MSTVHNPTNFEPKDYEVEDYLDNHRPEYCGQSVDEYAEEVKFWETDMERALGFDWRAKSHHCIHCGNGSVRWITAVLHIPTGERVVFGAVCTNRLGFADKVAFKLAQLQSKAEARKVRFTIWNKRQAFLSTHPEVADILARVDEPQHAKNLFVHDVIAKLNQYGELSPRQVECVISSMKRDDEYAARKAAEALEPQGDAPSGRVTVIGTVVSIKEQEGYMPGTTTLKMLVKLENNSKVWLTCTDDGIQRGDRIQVKATFQVSDTDAHFAFGKRPIIENIMRAS
jgi:hypothetical protein